MKRLILVLIVVFTAATLMAGEGKSCDAKKAAKTVQLTGTIASAADGQKVFRVADSNKSYTLCHKSSSEVAKLGADGATIQVKGKIVSCDEAEGEELVVETARKI